MACEERIPPVRGLIVAHNCKQKPFRVVDLARWLRLSRAAFGTTKADVLAHGSEWSLPDDLFATAQELDTRLSLRADACDAPYDLQRAAAAGLLDVFLTPHDLDGPHLEEWFAACRDAGLPLRVQLQPPFTKDLDPDRAADTLAYARAVAVNLALADPFVKCGACRDHVQSNATLDFINRVGRSLDARGIEANLHGIPFCLATEDNRARVVNTAQYRFDHQQYVPEAGELARKLYGLGPTRAALVIEMLLVRHTCYDSPIDRRLLPWLLDKGWLRARVWALHKLTRHFRFPGGAPRLKTETPEACTRTIARIQAQVEREWDAECRRCSLRYICDHGTALLNRALPGVSVSAIEGNVIRDPLHFAVSQRKYYDPVDVVRRNEKQDRADLAARANARVQSGRPTSTIGPFDYEIEGGYCRRTEDSVRWYGFTREEKVSTPLGRFEPPYTLSATFGGGIAEYIGFGFGRHARVVCPMTTCAHTVTLHVEADGRYVLLRDGRPVVPAAFHGDRWVPTSVRAGHELRLVIGNIDGWLVTQNVSVWRGAPTQRAAPSTVEFSFVVVSVRYARRLGAVLASIGHQEGISQGSIEALVAYVPGLDATDDVLDSAEAAYPALRLIRSPYPERYASAKGFMVNETARTASGGWVVLLDADTIPHPGLCATLGRLEPTCRFAAPAGRKMLPYDVTARILLGEALPWRDWETLVGGPGEMRAAEANGVPIGYCQCVRRECLDSVSYEEHGHFEGADWQFGRDLRERFGPETRLAGLPALHLDHGGSHWYGTRRHY